MALGVALAGFFKFAAGVANQSATMGVSRVRQSPAQLHHFTFFFVFVVWAVQPCRGFFAVESEP